MEKNIVKIEDFKEVFILFNNINCMFENNSFDNKNEIVSLISILSEVILNSSSDVNNQKIYSKITLAIVDEIRKKEGFSGMTYIFQIIQDAQALYALGYNEPEVGNFLIGTYFPDFDDIDAEKRQKAIRTWVDLKLNQNILFHKREKRKLM